MILKEVIESVNDEKEIFNIALKCVNCGHRDLLVKFLRVRTLFTTGVMGGGSWAGTSYNNPIPKSTPKKYVEIDGVKYDKNLTCLKCKSSLITLDEKFTKNNVVRML